MNQNHGLSIGLVQEIHLEGKSSNGSILQGFQCVEKQEVFHFPPCTRISPSPLAHPLQPGPPGDSPPWLRPPQSPSAAARPGRHPPSPSTATSPQAIRR